MKSKIADLEVKLADYQDKYFCEGATQLLRRTFCCKIINIVFLIFFSFPKLQNFALKFMYINDSR